ncbi:RanBP1 domain protein, partial [Ancylostoma caninum]
KTKGENDDGEADHGADEEYEPDVQFQPVIPLPDLVDVVTGEEEEQVVFTARAKLFRFIKETKENKERGVGDIKILRNPKTNAHRVVMRREQVHKVCANFAILPSIELNEKKGMPNVYNWICRDYSESAEGSDEIFTAKVQNTGDRERVPRQLSVMKLEADDSRGFIPANTHDVLYEAP